MGDHFPHPTPHPPPVGILFLPLTLLSYPAAASVWFGFQLLSLIASVYLLIRTEGKQWPLWSVVVAIALNTWYPVIEDLGSGQLMLFMLLLLVSARLCLGVNRPLLGGAMVGLAFLVKPVPWPILLLFAIRRDWRALGASVATILAGSFVGLLMIGPARLAYYLIDVLPTVTAGYRAIARNLSLWSIGWRLFDGTQQTVFGGTLLPAIAAPPLVKWPEAAAFVSIGLPLLVVLIACISVWRQSDLDAGYGLMICVSILVSPTSWSSYLVLALIPIAQVVAQTARHGFARRETAKLVVVLVVLFVPLFAWALLGYVIIGQAPPASQIGTLPLAPSLLTLSPALAVAALGCLGVWSFPGCRPQAGK